MTGSTAARRNRIDTVYDLTAAGYTITFDQVGPADARTVRMVTVGHGEQTTFEDLPPVTTTGWMDLAGQMAELAVFHRYSTVRAQARNVITAALALAADTHQDEL